MVILSILISLEFVFFFFGKLAFKTLLHVILYKCGKISEIVSELRAEMYERRQ